MLFSGKKRCFLCFLGGSSGEIRGDRGDRDYRGYRDYSLAFLFLAGGGRRRPQRGTASLLLFPSFCCRLFAVLLPSFYRLFTVFVSRLMAVGIKQGDFKKEHRNCYV